MALITMDDIEQIFPVFRGEKGHKVAEWLLRLTGIDRLAERYERHEDLTGPSFVNAFLTDLDVDYQVGGFEHLAALAEGPFVTVSNHPYGGLDGLILIDLIGHVRADYKVMVNQFLNLVKTIKDNFISVIPNTDATEKVAKKSIEGVRKSLMHVKAGHPLGLFPAGVVSDPHGFRIYDREWQMPAIRLIQSMKVPVLPIRFFDKNSFFFYVLGLVSWKIRTLRFPREVLNKSGRLVRVGIGPVISVEQQRECGSKEALGQLLRNLVYGIQVPKNLIKRSEIVFEF